MIDIYSQDGQLKCSVEPGSSSEQQKALQGDNVLSLSFTLYEAVMLDVNDYADFCGERYWSAERYLPKQISTVEWAYDVKLYGIESLIRRFLVLQNSDGQNEAVFTLTAPAREHAAMIIEAINKGMGTARWKVGSVIATENLTIDYEGTYCNEGLEKVAKAAGTEYWFEGTTLNICRAETGTELELGYGRGLTSLERDVADNVKFYTRLFPIGSSRNIDPSKYGHARLQLPDGKQYVDKDVQKYGVIHHYEAEAFKEIYPKRIGTVSSVRSVNKKGDDGKEFTIYYFKDDALSFDPNKYELAGKVKHAVFQSGELDGRDFEVNYDSSKKEFEIITTWPYKDGTQLPGGMLIPAKGDKYILWNLRMPDEYYPPAEKKFLQAVEAFNREHYIDRSVYKAPTDHVWVEYNNAELLIGRRVKLYSDKYFPETGYRSSRITKITRKVTLPSQADLEISDALSTGTMTKIEDSIGEVKSYARQAASALPDIIRTIDDTLPTDNNLFSARRILQDFLAKDRPGTLTELVTFLKGIALGKSGGHSLDATGRAILRAILSDNYRSGESGFALYKNTDGTTHLQVDYIEVLRKAVFAVLERRELSHVGGDTVFSGAGSKITKVEDTPDGYKCYFLADDGTTATRNEWQADDQAMCRTDNIRAGVHEGVSNRYYWRRVIAIGDDYVVLSKTDRDYTTDGQGRITHDSDVPSAGDKIVQFGNRTDKSRQNITMIRVQGEDAGIVQYVGVNGYTLEGKRVYISSPEMHEVAAKTFRLTDYNGDAYDIPLDKGQWQEGQSYYYHDRVSHDGSYWLCTIAPGQSTTEEPKDGSAVWQKQVSRGEKGDKGEAAIELHLDIVRGDMFYREGQGFVAELKATVIQGGKDLTPTLHASQMVWTRESEDAAGDEEWNARHRGIGDSVTITTDDLTEVTAVVFTLYNKDGTLSASEAVTF